MNILITIAHDICMNNFRSLFILLLNKYNFLVEFLSHLHNHNLVHWFDLLFTFNNYFLSLSFFYYIIFYNFYSNIKPSNILFSQIEEIDIFIPKICDFAMSMEMEMMKTSIEIGGYINYFFYI